MMKGTTKPKSMMIPKTTTFIAMSLVITAFLLLGCFQFGICRIDKTTAKMGGIRDINNLNGIEIQNLARFALDQHNKKENSLLKFVRLVKAKEQVVAGMLYHMTLEANDAGKTKVYETKVWVKPWMNFKEMTEFKVSDVDHSV
ncbi:cystatin A [Artemisia annua]|uniref:Cysteine proteinase inhibitor n=1 Tax=Artemisia annua TaxID=35608 RepID=A0A2U1P7U5_ARTAN|nr:cystatin A [Artemisia annua]